MTDVVKNYETKGAPELIADVESGLVHPIKNFLEPLQLEITTLGIPDDALFIMLSPNTRTIWNLLVDALESFEGVDPNTVKALRARTLANTSQHYTANGHFAPIMAALLETEYPAETS